MDNFLLLGQTSSSTTAITQAITPMKTRSSSRSGIAEPKGSVDPAIRESAKSSDYAGHYILLVDYQEASSVFEFFNPSSAIPGNNTTLSR